MGLLMETVHANYDVIHLTVGLIVREVREHGYPEKISYCTIRRSGQASETFHTCPIHVEEVTIIWPDSPTGYVQAAER